MDILSCLRKQNTIKSAGRLQTVNRCLSGGVNRFPRKLPIQHARSEIRIGLMLAENDSFATISDHPAIPNQVRKGFSLPAAQSNAVSAANYLTRLCA